MAPTSESVVTGDAVVLDVQVAQLPLRAVGTMIDVVVVYIGWFIGLILWALTLSQLDPALSAAFLIIFTVLAVLGYPLLFETLTRGRSLGKLAMGLRVVSDDGGPERFRQALFRSLAGVIEIYTFFGAPAVICGIFSSKGKRIGDLFSGTVVISERGPRLAPLPGMPPPLAAWASQLQLSGLSAQTADRARQFLSRAHDLNPQIRDQMAYRIASEVVAAISPSPPLGAPAQFVIAAVLAERHRREVLRLQGATAAPVQPWPTYPMQPPGYPPAQPYPGPQPSPDPVPYPEQQSSGGFAPPS
ncbi:MAG: RDD family protein [Mycobacterium sp.]